MALNEKWANWLITDLMHDFGLTKEQAIGFVGPLAMESKGFTDWQEDKPVVKGSRGGAGQAQWTGPRRVAYEKHTKTSGYEKDSYEAQYTYLRKELNGVGGHDGGIIKRLKKTSTIEEARDATTRYFLRPGITNAKARASWTDQVAAAYKPTPYNPIPDVASELSVRRGQEAPTPMRKPGRVAAAQLLNGFAEDESQLIRSTTPVPRPMSREAGDRARAKAENRDIRSQPGFLATVLEEAGILPSMAGGVKPLNPNNPLGAAVEKKAPVKGVTQLREGRSYIESASATGSVAKGGRAAETVKFGSKPKSAEKSESLGTAINRYRMPTIEDLSPKGSVPRVNQSDEEFTRSVFNGYREIQHMGPSSKGAKARTPKDNPNQQSIAERNGGRAPAGLLQLKPGQARTGATKTTAPSQEPIPRNVRPQVVVNGVDQNKRVTDPVASTRSHLRSNGRAASVAATSLLKAGLVDPKVATTVIDMDGVFVDGLKAPTPMDRIRGDQAREKARGAGRTGPAELPGRRPDSFGGGNSGSSSSSSKKSSSGGNSSGRTYSNGQSTPSGYTRTSAGSFEDSSGGVYYDRNLR